MNIVILVGSYLLAEIEICHSSFLTFRASAERSNVIVMFASVCKLVLFFCSFPYSFLLLFYKLGILTMMSSHYILSCLFGVLSTCCT
jgi:hypothetical protein